MRKKRCLGVSGLTVDHMLRLRAQFVAKDCHRVPQLVVGQVRSGAQAQDVTARIDEHAATAHLPCKFNRSWRANREKPGAALIRYLLHCRETRRDIELLERAFQKGGLVDN